LKLHEERVASLNTVTACGTDFVEINAIRHQTSVIVLPSEPVQPLAARVLAELSADLTERLLHLAPEVVLVGTGSKQRFGAVTLVRAFAGRQVGVEFMDTPAACRTYNILMTEGRRVLAVLLLEAPAA
jgi:uncharacterized protein